MRLTWSLVIAPSPLCRRCRINGVSAAYADLLTIGENEKWLSVLRGNYSRQVEGKATKQTEMELK